MYPKMRYCISVEGSVVHVGEVPDGKFPFVLQVSEVMPSGPVKLLLVLFEIANHTGVVVVFHQWEGF